MDQGTGGYVRGGSLKFFGQLTAELCEAVKATVELRTPLEDGTTKLDHLIQVEESTGQNHVPETHIPMEAEHLWNWFWSLSSARGSSGFGGAAPLSFTEIRAWIEVTGLTVHPWEIDAIRAMDGAYMQAQAEMSKAKSSKGKGKT